MPEYRLGEIEARFAELIWINEPVTSSELVKLAERELNWKKSTTYTVLRRLIQKGIFQNVDGTVTALLSREMFSAMRSRQFVEEHFSGSLPQFLAAFSRQGKLSEEDIAELRRIIDEHRG